MTPLQVDNPSVMQATGRTRTWSPPAIARPAAQAVSVTLLAACMACSNPFAGSDCVSIGVSGISVYVVDGSTNGAPSTIPVVRLTDGAYVETITAPSPGSVPYVYSGAVERPGRYEVSIEAAGYAPVTHSGVEVVRGGRCNAIRPVRIDVSLTRR